MADLYIPENLKRWEPGAGASAWDSAANYCGADLSDFYVAPIHKTRDTADALTLSNWQVVSAELDKLAKHEDTGETTIGHWACGWFAVYLIHETDTDALKAADEWAATLADYPVADEDALSELEYEEEQEAWDSWGRRSWRDAVVKVLERYAPEDTDLYWADETLDGLQDEDSALDVLWYEAANRCSWCCQHESDGPNFNIDEAAESLTAADLSNLTGQTILPPDQQWRREPYPWAGAAPSPLLPAED